MSGFTVSRIADAELVTYGPRSDLRVLVGDDLSGTPIRVALQTCQAGYVVPFHSHPYVEYLIVLEGSAAFKVESAEGEEKVELQKGDTVELHAGSWHSFTTSPTEVTRLLGIHLSGDRIVKYKDGVKTDSRGFRITDDLPTAGTASGE